MRRRLRDLIAMWSSSASNVHVGMPRAGESVATTMMRFMDFTTITAGPRKQRQINEDSLGMTGGCFRWMLIVHFVQEDGFHESSARKTVCFMILCFFWVKSLHFIDDKCGMRLSTTWTNEPMSFFLLPCIAWMNFLSGHGTAHHTTWYWGLRGPWALHSYHLYQILGCRQVSAMGFFDAINKRQRNVAKKRLPPLW